MNTTELAVMLYVFGFVISIGVFIAFIEALDKHFNFIPEAMPNSKEKSITNPNKDHVKEVNHRLSSLKNTSHWELTRSVRIG